MSFEPPAWIAAPAFALALAACGGGGEVASTGAASTDASQAASAPASDIDAAIANAEANQAGLQSADNVLDIEVLGVDDGSVQTLREVVDGDRPVLVWFFSPH